MFQVLIADDDPLLRSGLQRILDAEPDIEVPHTCDGRDTVATVLRYRPDVVLLDLRMAETDGLSVIAELQRRAKSTAITVLTDLSAGEGITAALRAGAAGYLLKDTKPRVLVNAVRLLGSGEAVLSSAVASHVFSGLAGNGQPQARAHTRLSALTARERQVLDLITAGLSNAEIGDRLTVSPATVKDHVSAILTKLGLANRVQAAVYAQTTTAAVGAVAT